MAAPIGQDIGNNNNDGTVKKRINWYEVMDQMIGEGKRPSVQFVPRSSFPQVIKSPEEIRVQNAFDSCAFKTIISGTMGNICKKYDETKLTDES
jgi:hypothetical protein